MAGEQVTRYLRVSLPGRAWAVTANTHPSRFLFVALSSLICLFILSRLGKITADLLVKVHKSDPVSQSNTLSFEYGLLGASFLFLAIHIQHFKGTFLASQFHPFVSV